MNLVWELVCQHLDPIDLGSLFRTSRELVVLSRKDSLWSFLMRRDFPEHFSKCPPGQAREWYHDLYAMGAYYVVTNGIVSLYPERPLYRPHTTFEGNDVWTYRQRNRNVRNWSVLRLPGTMFVDIRRFEDGKRVQRGGRRVLLSQTTSFQGSHRILPVDLGPFQRQKEWILRYFDVRWIRLEGSVSCFEGRLLQARGGVENDSLTVGFQEYQIHNGGKTGCLYSTSTGRFIDISDEEIPF
jgi:hypothetical protein